MIEFILYNAKLNELYVSYCYESEIINLGKYINGPELYFIGIIDLIKGDKQ